MRATADLTREPLSSPPSFRLAMDTLSLLHGIRLIDSFFPSGGYAFSSGLEAAVQGGAVQNGEDLRRFGLEHLTASVGSCEAVAVARAHEAVADGDLDHLLTLDRELDAMKVCRETRAASRQMGRQMLRAAGDLHQEAQLLQPYLQAVETGRAPAHLPVVLGAALARLGWPRKEAVAVFLYQWAVGVVSAGLKLLPIGQREGQRLLEAWLPTIVQLSAQAEGARSLRAFAPVHEIYAMQHRRLPCRLFRS